LRQLLGIDKIEYVYEIIKIAFAPASVIVGLAYLLKQYLESYSKRVLEKSLFEYKTMQMPGMTAS